MRKIFNIILSITILIFSFYYTHIVSIYIKENDNIMQEIKKNKDKFEQKEINAIIDNDTIIPGKCSKKVNIELSYKKMKRVNKYTESLLVFEEVKPSISIEKKYDKLIISGNPTNKNISILVKVNDINILKKLKDNESLNFILDQTFINNNYNYLKTINNNIVILENNNLVNLDIISYCYSVTYNLYCKNYNKYTIKPNFITNNYFYNTYKIIKNGAIIAYNIINENNIDNLNNIITYIKTLNYNILSIDELIKE